jgi:hypothetical protein
LRHAERQAKLAQGLQRRSLMVNLLSVADACRRITAAASSPAPARALRALARGLGRCRVMDLAIDNDHARANVIAFDEAREVLPGDVFYTGVRVSLPLQGGRMHAAPLFLRLACFNQLVWDGAALAGHESGARVRALLAEGVGRIRALRAQSVDNGWAGALVHEQELPHELREALEDAWRAEGAEPSRYGVLNALTRLATHDGALPVATRRALARAAERVAFG